MSPVEAMAARTRKRASGGRFGSRFADCPRAGDATGSSVEAAMMRIKAAHVVDLGRVLLNYV